MLNIAILLDLDNIKPKLTVLESIASKYGKLTERRAFSNTPAVLAAYGSSFRQFGYRFELTPALTTVPQEVDNLIINTVEEIVTHPTKKIQLVALVSNDNDYARLFSRLKAKGIKTLVIGNQIGNQLRQTADYVEILNEVMRPTYVGIDLGTTNTVMAIANINLMQQWSASVVQVPIKNEQSALVQEKIIPSSVRFNSAKDAEIGGHVKAQAYAFRDQTILAWKHRMGDLVNGKPFCYELSSGKITPEEAASKVLGFCRDKLTQKYGDIQGAVITHPASYESDAIEATRKAAALAGWKEEDVVLISEPQAALYDFLYLVQKGEIVSSLEFSQPCNILVYDLGGGTLDVTLHHVAWEHTASRFLIHDIAIGSRTRVGGDTVDQLIVDYIVKTCPEYSKLSEPEQKKLNYELLLFASKFKKDWGGVYTDSVDKETFKYPFQGNFLDAQVPIRYYISQGKMREILSSLLCEDLNLNFLEELDVNTAFDQTPFVDRFNTFVVPVLEVLLKAKQTTGKLPRVDGILLNGGMTYFPPVKERLAQLFQNTPIIDDGNPDLAVARGASLFAAGVLKRSEGINPTNIYLEVEENSESHLRLLIAQGQKYPYKTLVSGFKLPNTDKGYIGFKAWVGMGSKCNVNTTLQRLRRIPMEKILEANLKPGMLLDLEVEYTFDERLLLTLIAKETTQARFQLEVANHDSNSEPSSPGVQEMQTSSNIDPGTIIPTIARTRVGNPADSNIKVAPQEWEIVAKVLSSDWNNARAHQQRRDLERKTANAKNRLAIADELIRWLEAEKFQYLQANNNNNSLVATMALVKIFRSFESNNQEVAKLEEKFKEWVKTKLTKDLAKISNDLFSEIAETPGQLLWSGFDAELLRAFKLYQNKAISARFLNSLGKCGQPSVSNLNFLGDVIKNSPKLGIKEKAAWALGRLISPGQPQQYKAVFREVEQTAFLAIQQLYSPTIEPQVALNILGCLCQCLAWHAEGQHLNQSLCSYIKKLPTSSLPVEKSLSKFPSLESVFESKLALLPKMLNLSLASKEEITQIKDFLLQSVSD